MRHIKVIRIISGPNPSDWHAEEVCETLIECLAVEDLDLPINLGRQEMTFSGFKDIDPETVFHVKGVRRHYKLRNPYDSLPSLGHGESRPVFIDATVWVS